MTSNRLEIPANKPVREWYDATANIRRFRQFHADSGNGSLATAQWAADVTAKTGYATRRAALSDVGAAGLRPRSARMVSEMKCRRDQAAGEPTSGAPCARGQTGFKGAAQR